MVDKYYVTILTDMLTNTCGENTPAHFYYSQGYVDALLDSNDFLSDDSKSATFKALREVRESFAEKFGVIVK